MRCGIAGTCFLSVLWFGTLADTVSAQETGWQFKAFDSFRVLTTIQKETTIQVGDRPAVVTNSTDEFVVSYAIRPGRARRLFVEVRISGYQRKTPSANSEAEVQGPPDPQMQKLNGFQLLLELDNAGALNLVEGSKPLNVLTADMASRRLLNEVCPDETIVTWVGRPFWFRKPLEELEESANWSQQEQISLGAFGQLKTILNISLDEIKEDEATFEIEGDARRVPSITKTPSALELDDVIIDSAGVSGNAVVKTTLETSAPDNTPPSRFRRSQSGIRRPPFDQLKLQWTLSGTASVATAGAKKKLTFKQTRTTTSVRLPSQRLLETETLLIE